MSGGGSGSGGGRGSTRRGGVGGDGGQIPKSNCKDLSFTTNLRSPNPRVLRNLHIDSILNIEIDPDSGAVVAMHNHQIAGSITSAHLAQLIRCMGNDFTYIATVQSIDGGNCEVLITSI